MTKADGLPKTEYAGFRSLALESFPGRFSCAYLRDGEPVHAKVYVWLNGTIPVQAFTGSANYTQNAFLNSDRREVLAECDPRRAYDFFKSLAPDCVDCLDPNVKNVFQMGFLQDRQRKLLHGLQATGIRHHFCTRRCSDAGCGGSLSRTPRCNG